MQDKIKAMISDMEHQKKMSDLDYQIKLSQAKKMEHVAGMAEKQQAGGMMNYLSTPNDPSNPYNHPLIGQNQR
jgi:hypothetical protein